MNIPNNIAEIKVTYSHPVPPHKRIVADSSEKLLKVLHEIWEEWTLEYRECFYLILFNNNLQVLWYRQMTTGGLTRTIVDVKQIMAVALQWNAAALAVAHNHPSGTRRPSNQDRQLTREIKKACNLFDIRFCHHIIVMPWWDYYSFSEEENL